MAIKDAFRGGIAASFRKRLKDDFQGVSETGLGIASDGSGWKAIRGQFNIDGTGSAEAINNDYAIAAVDMGVRDVEISLAGTGSGSSAALWVSDSGNWFAVGLRQEPTNCNCTTYYNSNYYYSANGCISSWNTGFCAIYGPTSCKTYSNPCNAYNTSNCTGYNTSNCAGYYYSKYTGKICSSYNGSNCKGYNGSNCKTYSSPCNAYNSPACLSSNSPTPNYYGCTVYGGESGPYQSCQTCYPQYIRVIQSVSSSISTLAEWALSSLANSFRVKTSNNQIEITAFSNSDFTSQLDGTLTYTPTNVDVQTNFGIMVSPSSYNQQLKIGDVEIKRNPN